MKRRASAFLLLVLTGASCRYSGAKNAATTTKRSGADLCAMTTTALREVVRSYAEQPLGLEDVCVHRMAEVAGQVVVDARFWGEDGRIVLAEPCQRDGFSVRFDPKRFQPSQSDGVLLFIVSHLTEKDATFNAMIESPIWPARRPNTIGLSPCGSSTGILRRRADSGWEAEVVPPQRAPDAL